MIDKDDNLNNEKRDISVSGQDATEEKVNVEDVSADSEINLNHAPPVIESEMQIERGLNNARSIVSDTYEKSYIEHADIQDTEKREKYARFETLCVSIIVSGGFFEDVLLKRADAPDKQVENKQGRTDDLKKDRLDRLNVLSGVDASVDDVPDFD